MSLLERDSLLDGKYWIDFQDVTKNNISVCSKTKN